MLTKNIDLEHTASEFRHEYESIINQSISNYGQSLIHLAKLFKEVYDTEYDNAAKKALKNTNTPQGFLYRGKDLILGEDKDGHIIDEMTDKDKQIINQAFISKVGEQVGGEDVNYRYGAENLTLMEVKKGVVVVNHLQELREANNWEKILNQVHEAEVVQQKNLFQKIWDSMGVLHQQQVSKFSSNLEEESELTLQELEEELEQELQELEANQPDKEEQIIEAKETIKKTLETLYLTNTVAVVTQEEVNNFVIANSYLEDDAYLLKITPNPDGNFNLSVENQFPIPPVIEKNSLSLDLDSQPPQKSGIELTKEILEQSRDNETTIFGTAALTSAIATINIADHGSNRHNYVSSINPINYFELQADAQQSQYNQVQQLLNAPESLNTQEAQTAQQFIIANAIAFTMEQYYRPEDNSETIGFSHVGENYTISKLANEYTVFAHQDDGTQEAVLTFSTNLQAEVVNVDLFNEEYQEHLAFSSNTALKSKGLEGGFAPVVNTPLAIKLSTLNEFSNNIQSWNELENREETAFIRNLDTDISNGDYHLTYSSKEGKIQVDDKINNRGTIYVETKGQIQINKISQEDVKKLTIVNNNIRNNIKFLEQKQTTHLHSIEEIPINNPTVPDSSIQIGNQTQGDHLVSKILDVKIPSKINPPLKTKPKDQGFEL